MDKTRSLAEAVVAAWEVWAESDGWNNDEYDVLADALIDLREHLKSTASAMDSTSTGY